MYCTYVYIDLFPGRWRTIDAEDLIITNKVISQELTGTFSRGKRIEDIYNYLAEFCVQPAFPTPRSEVSILNFDLSYLTSHYTTWYFIGSQPGE